MVCAETALGWVGALLGRNGVRHGTLFHATREGAELELRASGGVERPDQRTADVSAILRAYAAGDAVTLGDYPLDLPPCRPFQRAVWLSLREIPRGQTRSYGWLAGRVDRQATAARAIGAAVAANPLPLWLPCHRVVARDGSLRGFAGGLAMKRALLELEGALPSRLV